MPEEENDEYYESEEPAVKPKDIIKRILSVWPALIITIAILFFVGIYLFNMRGERIYEFPINSSNLETSAVLDKGNYNVVFRGDEVSGQTYSLSTDATVYVNIDNKTVLENDIPAQTYGTVGRQPILQSYQVGTLNIEDKKTVQIKVDIIQPLTFTYIDINKIS